MLPVVPWNRRHPGVQVKSGFDHRAQGYDRTEELEVDVGDRTERLLELYDFEVAEEEPLPAEPCGCSRRGAAPACRARNVWHKGRNG